jgi:hypothetical protein
MKKYSIVVTPGTRLFRCHHSFYGSVISTAARLSSAARGDETGTILELCGRSLMDLDPTKHNGRTWFCVRNNVMPDHFEITERDQ